MKRKQIFSVATIGVLSLLLVAGAAVAAVFPEDNTFTGNVNSFEKGIKIGKQGTGGVTFFNGTIVNQTTTNGQGNPVTFGDDVRIDGGIQRGTNNANDTWPVKVNDDMIVSGDLTIRGNVIKERRMVIPASAFQVSAPGAANYNNIGSALGNLRTDQNDIFTAPVLLPAGATVRGVVMNYLSKNSTPITMSLEQHPFDLGSNTPAKNIVATGNSEDGKTAVNLTLDRDYITVVSDSTYILYSIMPKKDNAGSDPTELYEVIVWFE